MDQAPTAPPSSTTTMNIAALTESVPYSFSYSSDRILPSSKCPVSLAVLRRGEPGLFLPVFPGRQLFVCPRFWDDSSLRNYNIGA